MKIFGSISELVEIAFRLAGGKQVRLLSPTQSSSADVTVRIPDVGTENVTQDMILQFVSQDLQNKAINASTIGLSTPLAGAFTDLDAANFSVSGDATVAGQVTLSGSAEINNLTLKASGTAVSTGVVHADAAGLLSSSLLVNADITNAVISASKFAPILEGYIYIGQPDVDGSPVAPQAKQISGDVTLSASGDVQIVAGAVGDNELASSVSASKILVPNVSSPAGKKPVVTDANGVLIDNPAALTDGAILSWDATNGQFSSISSDVTADELSQLDGINTDQTIQAQLDAKEDSITGGASSITSADLTVNRALVSDASGKVAVSPVTNTQLGYLSNTTGDIQSALNTIDTTLNGLGTISTQDANNVAISGGYANLSSVFTEKLTFDYSSQVVSSGNVLTIEDAFTGVGSFNGTAEIQEISSAFSSGAVVFIKNVSASDCVIKNGVSNILTGTGEDFDFLAGAVAPFLYDGTDWNLAGGAGAGGGAGVSREISQSSHGFSVGDVLYFDGSSYLKAKADAANTAEVVGIVSEVKDSSTFVLLSGGYIEGLSGLTAGSVHYLSSSTAGELTVNEPGVIGEVSKPVLIADSASSGYLVNYRGVVVGGSNARTSLSLNNNGSTNIQDMSDYDAGELSGWVYIDATSPLRFYVEAQVSKNGAGNDYNISYQTSGDTPPSGFDMNVSSAGMVSVVLPDVSGFSSANINYSLNAAAVGVDLPLSLDASNIQTGTLSSDVLPKKKIQTKKLPITSNVNLSFFHAEETSSGVFGNSSFRIDNLVIGQLYRLRIRSAVGFSATSAYTSVFPEYISPTGGETYPTNFQNRVWFAASQGTAGIEANSLEVVFTATSSSIGFKQSYGGGSCSLSAGHTSVTIEELTDYEEVDTF